MLRVLGEVGVDGAPPLTARSRRVLLAALLLDRPAPVPCDRLVHLLWPVDLPGDPAAALHTQVSRLRRHLPDHVRLVPVGHGYRVEPGAEAVDADLLVAALAAAPGTGDEQRLAAVETGLALWRGTPYADLDDDRAEAERERLRRVRAALLDARAEALLGAGRLHEAVAALEDRRADDPLRERTVELLMHAYVRAGRRGDALEAYRRLRADVVEQLGLDPSPVLRDLEAAVVTDALLTDAPVPGARPPRPRHPSPPHDLPAEPVAPRPPGHPVPRDRPGAAPLPVSSLVGRTAELAAARSVLGDGHRLLTLVGPGGVGKTRLALHLLDELAAARPDGPAAVLVELSPLRHADDLPSLVASTLGVPHGSGGSPVDRVVAALGHGEHLLLVDNCEHVVEAAAALVEAVLTRTSGVSVVATSREPLHVDGERLVRVAPLGPADAAELLTDRAQAVDPGLPDDEPTRALLRALATALDGLPLALELAAARLATASVEELLAGLGARLSSLDGGRRTAAPRHRSLRSLVEWSVRDLDPDLRTTFARLSVLAAPAAVTDAAVVCGEPAPVVAVRLAALADRSLLTTHRQPGRPVRFGLLQTVRAYAADLLAASDDAGTVRDRHAGWVLDVVRRAAGPVPTDPTGGSLDRLAEVRVAHRWLHVRGDGDRALRLAAGLHHLALFRMQAEVFGWVTETAERFGHVDHPDAERVLASACIGAWQRGDLDRARDLAARAVEAGERSRWPGAGAGGAGCTGDVLGFSGDLDGALAAWQRAVRAARDDPSTARLVSDLADGAMVASYLHRWEVADGWLAEARRLLGEEPSWLSAWVDYAEGEALAERDPARSLGLLGRALSVARRTSADFVVGVAGLTRVGLQVRSGDPRAGAGDLVPLLERWRRGGAWVQLSIALRTCAELLHAVGDDEGAAVLLGALRAGWVPDAVAGPDAVRLGALREALADRPDLRAAVARGVGTPRDAVVDDVLRRLGAAAGDSRVAAH